jgi:cytochrome c-type biogenesis protein CcmF
VKAFTQNQRRYGGLITHIGVLVLILGIVGSAAYRAEKTVIMQPGDEMTLEDFHIKFIGLQEVTGVNWTAREGIFNVYERDKFLTELKPQKRVYNGGSQMPTTEAAIFPIRMGDLYLSLSDLPAAGGATVMALHNPLVHWLWYGGGIMGTGVILIMLKRKRRTT